MISNSIRELGEQIQSRELSVFEIVSDLINDVSARDANLGAFSTINPELLLAGAKASDDLIALGNYLGPLHGVPIGIKDIINVAGYPTQCGSKLYSSKIQQVDAKVTNALKTNGAIIAGKTTSHELACGVVSPPASNPWNTKYIPGGSSGGSGVAVACGYVRAALGSDTGGSIRIPASLCGVVGLKPTYGLISTTGVEPLSVSLDHIGPLAASVEDCALVLNALVRSNSSNLLRNLPDDYTSQLNSGISGMRIGILSGKPFSPMQPDVEQSFESAISQIQQLGAICINIDIPELEHTLAVEFGIIPLEASDYHLNSLQNHPELISQSIKTLLIAGRVIPRSIYLRASQGRKIITGAIRRMFEEKNLDAVITPTLPATAAAKGQNDFLFGNSVEDISVSYVRTTAPFNVSGQPAISVPCGIDSNGLPIGLQIATRPYDEIIALRIANSFTLSTKWCLNSPRR
ncbi:MAG: amidase [Acidimicrobiaceae bacterium]|nr:amidase [Acidimicrobiaceae bacterium]